MTSLIYSVNVDWLSDFSKVEPHRWSRTKLPCGLCRDMPGYALQFSPALA